MRRFCDSVDRVLAEPFSEGSGLCRTAEVGPLFMRRRLGEAHIAITKRGNPIATKEEAMDTVTLDKRLSQPAKEFLHQPSRLLIDGKLVEAASGKTFPVYNPATGAILMQVAEADSADVD